MDIKTIAAYLQLEEEEAGELVELFISTTLSDMNKIRDAVRFNDFENAAGAAHSIKGAASSMGLDRISSLAGQAETLAKEEDFDQMEEMLGRLKREIASLSRQTEAGN
ncbi:MAG: Hpt domain-containing protein [Thermodesulfobacteriota bacterium]